MTEKRLTRTARKLRRNMTDAERQLWSRLRNRQLDGRKFVARFPVASAVADFTCRRAKLVVELDGGQHDAAWAADAERTRRIERFGFTVIRFWNSDVMSNLDGVLEEIRSMLAISNNE